MRDIIQYSMYKWAPETFKCNVNGEYFHVEDPSTLGTLFVSGKTKEVDDRLKRMIRARRKQRRRVTFGFFGKGNNRYYYTRELGAYDDDLKDKLRIYKLWKQYVLSCGCDMTTYTITEGSFNPFGNNKGITTESHDYVDITRPCKIKYEYREAIV